MRRPFDPPARQRPSQTRIVVVALLALGALGGLVWFAAVSPRGVPGFPYYRLHAVFGKTDELKLLSEVHVAGRRVGEVSSIDYRGGRAYLTIILSPSERYLRSDTTARIRLKNALGDRYVELTPGRSGDRLHDGATIPESQTSVAVDYPTLLSAFSAPTRRNLSQTIKGFGGGLAGQGTPINEALTEAPALLGNVNLVSDAILARAGVPQRFVSGSEQLVGAYDPVRAQLARGFDPEARALAPFGDQRRAVQATLVQAPGALGALRTGLGESTPLLDETAGLARATAALARPAPAAFTQTAALLSEGTPALARTKPLLRAISQAVTPTLSSLSAIDPLITPTQRALLDQLTPLQQVTIRQCDLDNWAADWRSALGWGVPAGTDVLFPGLSQSEGIGMLNSFRVLAAPLADLQNPNPDGPVPPNAPIGRDPYPGPCQAFHDFYRPPL